jgi:hypothetical protein
MVRVEDPAKCAWVMMSESHSHSSNHVDSFRRDYNTIVKKYKLSNTLGKKLAPTSLSTAKNAPQRDNHAMSD